MNNRLINTKVAGGGGGCTDIVDNYDPFGGGGVALYQLNGNANDVSGNYDASWNGTPVYGTGVFGQAAVLDGSKYINGLPLLNNNFTVSLWFNSTGLTGNRMILSTNTSPGVGWQINNNTTDLSFVDRQGLLSNQTGIFSTVGSISTGVWYNVVISMSSTDVRFYLNGEEIGTATKSAAYSSTGTALGYQQDGGGYKWGGSIDQVRVFNTALDPLEVEALYTEELCICDGTVDTLQVLGDTSCIATYQLDGNANDLSGNYSGTPTDVSYGVGEFDLAGVFDITNQSQIQLPTGSPFDDSDTIKTISYWFKLNGTDFLRPLSLSDTGSNFFTITNTNTAQYFFARKGSSSNQVNAEVSVSVDNNWHHIAYVYNATATKIYLDGVEQAVSFSTNGDATNGSWISYPAYSGTPIPYIGRNRQTSPSYSGGSIDQMRLFNKALNSTEVTTLYNETACTKAACTGTTNTLDILGDGSCVATYPLDGSPADLSGNYNGVQTDVTYPVGEFDLAGAFNGTSSKVSTSTYGLSGNASYSASLWFNLGDTSGDQVLYSFGNTVAYQGSSLYIRNNNQIYHANNANADFFTSVPTLSAGVWYHFVLTYSSGSLTAYINNSSIGTVPISTGVLNITGNLGRIGCDIYDNNFLNGQIDQVRIFNKAISPSEVTTLYNEGL